MKVLSIKEPYATLIKNEIKFIETRSWKTLYRGDLIIHSCKGVYPIKEKIKHLVSEQDLKYGQLLCVVTLEDCIYIDEKFAEKIKKEDYNNYLCGDYSVGRYAWVLSNVRVLKKPVEVSGQLSLWNYDGVIE